MLKRALPLPPRVYDTLERLRAIEKLNQNKNPKVAQELKKERPPSCRRRCEKKERMKEKRRNERK